jgi:Protein of unknown function (DUF1800)
MKKKTAGNVRHLRLYTKTVTGLAALCFLSALTLVVPYMSAAKDKKIKSADSSKTIKGLPAQDLTEDEAILHALNRLAFGPKPGDLERVKEMGLQKWIERQLQPDSINDAALDTRLDRFSTLRMSSSKLLDEFPQPQVAARREGVSIEEYRKEQQARVQAATQANRADGDDSNPMNDQVQTKFENMDSDTNPAMDNPQILQASLDDPVKKVNAAMIAGLVLGSPEFQRR